MVQVDRLMYCCQESEPLGVVVNILIIEEGFIQKIRQRLSLVFREGAEFIHFLAELVVLHQDDMKKRINCTRMIQRKG